MSDPSIAHAEQAADALATLLASVNTDTERAFELARKAVEQDLALATRSQRQSELKNTLRHLEAAIHGLAEAGLWKASRVGWSQAVSDANLFGVTFGNGLIHQQDVESALEAVDADMNRQIRLILALLLIGMNTDPNRNYQQVFGGRGRVGLFTASGGVVRSMSFWATTLAAQAYDNGAQEIATQVEGLKRIAVLGKNRDHTETCLNVEGQVVGLDEDFTLKGEPKFAEKMHSPPFHWHCYTRVALVLA